MKTSACILNVSTHNEKGISSESHIFKNTNSYDKIQNLEFTLAQNEDYQINITTGYVLAQFLLSGSNTEIDIEIDIERSPSTTDSVLFKTTSLFVISDPAIKTITISNNQVNDARINLILSERKSS